MQRSQFKFGVRDNCTWEIHFTPSAGVCLGSENMLFSGTSGVTGLMLALGTLAWLQEPLKAALSPEGEFILKWLDVRGTG